MEMIMLIQHAQRKKKKIKLIYWGVLAMFILWLIRIFFTGHTLNFISIEIPDDTHKNEKPYIIGTFSNFFNQGTNL